MIEIRTEHTYRGPRFSWVAIAVLIGPAVVTVRDVLRRYDEVQTHPAPIVGYRMTRRVEPDELDRVVAPSTVCTCTGTGDPLCSEIPGQTCRVSR